MTSSDRWQYAKREPTPDRRCKDCVDVGIPTVRPAPFPGPRCYSHDLAFRKDQKKRGKSARVTATYSITPEQYDALYRFQAGRCAGCRRATGASKRLAVDHDHMCCPGPTSCGKCVRGLLCSTCNSTLAHFRDDAHAFERMAAYLRQWPSRRAGVVPTAPQPDPAVYSGHHAESD